MLTELPGGFTNLIAVTGGHYDLTVWVRPWNANCDQTTPMFGATMMRSSLLEPESRFPTCGDR